MGSVVSSKEADQEDSRNGLGTRRTLGAVVALVAFGVLGAGVVMPLALLDDALIAGSVGSVTAITSVFVASGLLTLVAVLWYAPRSEGDDGSAGAPHGNNDAIDARGDWSDSQRGGSEGAGALRR